MNDNSSPCIEFQYNRWAPNICCFCYLHKSRHSDSATAEVLNTTTNLSASLPSIPIDFSKILEKNKVAYESVGNLKSNYLLQNRKSAQLQSISPTLLSLESTSEKPPSTFSIEKDILIEKSLPLYFNKNKSLDINNSINNNIIKTPTKMNIVKEPVIVKTISPTKVITSTSVNKRPSIDISPTTPRSTPKVSADAVPSNTSTSTSTTTLTKNNKDDSTSTTITTSTSSSNSTQCKEFIMHQWRPNICVYCFLPKSKHTTTTTTTTTTTSLSSNTQSTTILTTTTTITTSAKKPIGSTIQPSTTKNYPPLLLKSKSLPPKLIPKLSQASLDLTSFNLPSHKLLLTPPTSLPTLKPILISKSISEPDQLNNNNNSNINNVNSINSSISTTTSTTEVKSESNDNSKRFSITISTSTSKTSILSPPTFTSSNSNGNLENTLTSNLLEEEKPTSKRNSGTIQPLRLKSFSFSNAQPSVPFDDDPFKDFEDLVDDDDNFDSMDKNETLLTITTPSQTTIVSNTTTILQSPRVIEKTTTTTSSIIPSTTSNSNNTDINLSNNTNSNSTNNNTLQPSTTTTTTKRRSIKMDQFKEKEDDWDQGMDLTSFLKKQRKKASSKKSSKSSGGMDIFSDFSYCSNKFMEISSVKEEAQRQSVDFGGGIHPNAFEAFKGILEAKQKQISKAFERNKIDQSDCEKLGDELNSVQDLLHTLMENFNKNPPIISLQNTKDIHKDIQDLNSISSQSQLHSICVSSDNSNNFD